MSLLTCTDCHRAVSSRAVVCLGCGRPLRERSYLTPEAQTVVGAIVLMACFAWPPMLLIVVLALLGHYLVRARRGSTGSLIVAAAVLLALGVVLMYVMPGDFFIIGVLTLATLAWLVSSRLGRIIRPDA